MVRLLALLIVIFVIQQNQTAKISNSKSGIENCKIATISDMIFNVKYLWYNVLAGNEIDFSNTLNKIQNATLELDIIKNYHDKRTLKFHGKMFESEYVGQFETRYKKFKEYLWKIPMNDSMNQSIRDEVAMYIKKNQEDLTMGRVETMLMSNITKWFKTRRSRMRYSHCDYKYVISNSYIYSHHQVIILTLETYLIHTFSSALDRYYSDFNIDNVMWPAYDRMTRLSLWLERHLKRVSVENFECTRHEPVRISETVELEGIVQKFIAIEPDMDDSGTCHSESCPVPTNRKLLSKFPLNGYRRSKPCHGEIWDCHPVDNIGICYAKESISKRYEGFELDDRIYGNIDSCICGLSTISSWRRWIFFKCDVCLCNCIADRDITQTHALNYAPQTSDIENNMVVTNVRFVEKNNIIHIQIEQEQLSLLTSYINGSSKSNWKPITDVDARQVHIWEKTVHLDNVMVPSGHVVTGVKFGAYQPPGGLIDGSYHLFQIHVRATPYDWMENKLIISQSGEDTSDWVTPQWMNNTIPAYERKRTFLPPFYFREAQQSPLHRLNIKDSEPNQYIDFRSSDLQDDAGQSTIPFFDSRPPFSKKPFPLSGIGISLKGYGSVNGYLTLKTFPYIHDAIKQNLFEG